MLINRRLAALAPTLVCGLVLTACPKQTPTTGPPKIAPPPDGRVPVTVHVPPPGQEENYLRAVNVVIEIDRDNRLSAVADPDDPNVVCGIPRVFYPPGGEGPAMERPKLPARQVRWTVRCDGRLDNCLKPHERIVIRPKDLDRLDRGCRNPDPEPKPCDTLELALTRIAHDQGMELDAFKKKKRSVEQRHQRTLFSAETGGTYIISGGEGRLRRQQGSVTSGVPNRPDFSLTPDLGWHYYIELWRGDERIDCLDPDVWVENDGGSGGRRPGG